MENSIFETAVSELSQKGFLDLPINPKLDLFDAIEQLKKEKEAVILAHYYQKGEIQDIADFLGDSLALAQAAAKTEAKLILFAGVHFMAETAKILNPTKKVLLPDLLAGCSLADSAPADAFAAFKLAHPNHLVISYINCTADVKALTDIIVTSSNALAIINSLPPEQPIIFAPDKNLGAYLNKKTGRNMLLWDGACMVHEIFSLEQIVKLKILHPNAQFIAHPECEDAVLSHAHFVGSTSELLRYTIQSDCNTFIVGTEAGIIHQMQKTSPLKHFIPAPPDNGCACNDCPYMKRNTLEKVYLALLHEKPEITMPNNLMQAALKPIQTMLDLSAKFGL